MTTLLELCAQVDGLASQVRVANDRRNQQAAWDQFNATVNGRRQALARPNGFLRWMDGLDGAPNSGAPTARQLSTVTSRMAALLTQLDDGTDPTAIQERLLKLDNSLGELISSQEERATTAWRNYVDATDLANPDIYAAFRDDDNHADNVRRLNEITRAFHGLAAKRYLADDEDRVAFLGLLADHEKVVKALPAMDDEEVRDFLASAASREGAPLAHLTENVLAWLRGNRLTPKYSIRKK